MILRILKYLALGVLGVVLLAVAVLAFIWWRGPARRPTTAVSFPRTPERVARGKYVAERVAGCILCHSQRDERLWSRPVTPGTEATGSCMPDEPGSPGHMCPPNITPDPVAGIGSWTDDEIARAIREQVDRQGRPLFAFHADFIPLSDDDVQAVVAYLRTLPPSSKSNPRTEVPLPFRFLAAFTGDQKPAPITQPIPTPDRQNPVAYGRYLVEIANCVGCHSPRDDDSGQPIPGQEFSGGRVFHGVVRSANLTPDPSGLGNRTLQDFIGMFRAYASHEAAAIAVDDRHNTPMPWVSFSGLSDEDLGAIYAYLRTVKPVHRVVEKFVSKPSP